MADLTSDSATGALVEFALGLRLADLPDDVRHEATRALLDAMGCAVGGARHAMADCAHAALRDFCGPPTTTILGRAEKADPLHAALMNGLAGAAYSFFDTYSDALLHPGGPVLSALLAVAERRPVTGAAFLAAFACGVEVACRLTRMTSLPPAQGSMSWSQSGVAGGVAAALAAGRLLGLPPRQLHSALAIAVSEAAGTRVEHGTMAASLIFGRAAQSGLRAALLAEGGFTGSAFAIEGRHGYAAVFSAAPNLAALTGRLGAEWELRHDTYKPYPTGVVVHPAIDVMLDLAARHRIAADQVTGIRLWVTPAAVSFGDRPDPADDLQAKFSIQHWAAVALAFGRAGIAEGANAVVHDAGIRRLRSVVTVTPDPLLPPYGARATVDLADGRQHAVSVAQCTGSPGNPMSDAALDAKFRQQCTPVIGGPAAERLSALCWGVTDLASAAALAAAARPAPDTP